MAQDAKKTGGKSLLSTLRDRKQPAAAAPASSGAAAPAAKPKSILSKSRNPVFEVRNYTLTVLSEERLPDILKEASPFIAPLSVSQLLELLYCECVGNPKVHERAKKAGKVETPDGRRTTIRLETNLHDWITRTYGGTSHASLTTFIDWIASDWHWIKSQITYRGLK